MTLETSLSFLRLAFRRSPLRMLARSSPSISVRIVFSPFFTSSLSRLKMAVRLARASKQPLLPQPHFSSEPASMTMWPISPAVRLKPPKSFPSRMTPAPMPVPMKMPTTCLNLPLSCRSKTPSAQTLQSFSMKTGTSSSFSRSFFNGTSVHRRFGAKRTLPDSGSTAPGAPRPTPFTCFIVRSHSSTASRTTRLTRSRTALTPRSDLVLTFSVPMRRSCASKTPASTFVPPMSTPT